MVDLSPIVAIGVPGIQWEEGVRNEKYEAGGHEASYFSFLTPHVSHVVGMKECGYGRAN